MCFFVSHLGRGKAAQDKAVSKSFSQDANTGQVTSGSQFTQSKHKNVYKFTAPPSESKSHNRLCSLVYIALTFISTDNRIIHAYFSHGSFSFVLPG